MKKLINTVLLLFLIGTVSSCLKSGLDDLEAYNEAEITNLNFEYRWWDEAKDQMAVKTLNIEKQISKDDNLITCKLTVPTASGSFTDAVRQNVSLSNLIAYIDLSTAARIMPLNGAPKLGSPGDFSAKEFKYQVIDGVSKQFAIVSRLLNRPDIDTIYICTDSGREGEYIYRLVDQMAGVKGKIRKRVWIDSQTEEEILRGIREAKDWSEYDNLSASAYLRAKEDYLMGINFSRLLTLKYGNTVANYLKKDRTVVSVGRVMTCVLGMVVRREREIRNFVKTPFYRVIGTFEHQGMTFDGEWKSVLGSRYFETPFLYKENGFKEKKTAEQLIAELSAEPPVTAVTASVERKKETKNPPLLYNLAELQNDCSKMFKISPDETLRVVQELYEKKLVTYPRTDARGK